MASEILLLLLNQVKDTQNEHAESSVAPTWAVLKTAELFARLEGHTGDRSHMPTVVSSEAPTIPAFTQNVAEGSAEPDTSENVLVEVERQVTSSSQVLLANEVTAQYRLIPTFPMSG